ncbi:MAG TPA: ImuA protein [Hyphomicrobiaceae bacterium]
MGRHGWGDCGLPADLAHGALNEVVAAHGDRPAAFGFLFALAALALGAEPETGTGPAVFVAARRTLTEFGVPYGHGLVQFGLDVDRLILVEAETDKDALWALEETLRSEARPAVVAGALAGGLDLTSSRRLNLAAAPRCTALVLLTGALTGTTSAEAAGTSAAATRWRIAAAPAARDRFGALAAPRWHAALERCRMDSSTGSRMGRSMSRPGAWVIEWDHGTHRFRVVEGLADRPPVAGTGLRRAV